MNHYTQSASKSVPPLDAIDRERSLAIVKVLRDPKPLPSGEPSVKTFRTAVANALYIVRKDGADPFGPTPGFVRKAGDLVDLGRRGPIGCDAPAVAGLELWRQADTAAAIDRPDLPSAFHIVGWLPCALDPLGWRTLVLSFVDEQVKAAGMIADWAIHARAAPDGGWATPPHMHAVVTARAWREGRNAGQRNRAWLGSKRAYDAAEDAWRALVNKYTPGLSG